MSDIAQAVAAHLSWMQDEQFSPVSIASRTRALARTDAALPNGLGDVYPHEIKTYLSQDGWAPWTRHTYDSHLRGFYAWGVQEGWFDHDPMLELARWPTGQFTPIPLTPGELSQALDRSPEPWYTCIILGVGAGLRASEMAELRREDVTDRYVHVRCGKGGRARLVDTCQALWTHLCSLPAGPVLRRLTSPRPVTVKWLVSAQRLHWRSIGLPQIHLHRFRHTFCTTMIEDEHDSLVVRDLMGHASVATTQGYALVSGRRRRSAVASVDRLLTALRPSAPAG